MAFLNQVSQAARTMRAVCILGAFSLAAAAAWAQSPVPNLATNTANAAAPKPDVRPYWNELTPAQQQALTPLSAEWNKMDSAHKSKWLSISAKYATLSPDMQKRMQDNMRDWAKLTPEQRHIARESYARAKALPPEQKAAKWQQYQQLPEEQKQKLAADAAAKKRIVSLPSPQSKVKTVEPLKGSKPPVHPVAVAPNPSPPSAANVTPASAATSAPTVPVSK